MERKDIIQIAFTFKRLVRSCLTLNSPSNGLQGCKTFLALVDGRFLMQRVDRILDADWLGFTIFKLISDNTKGQDFSL